MSERVERWTPAALSTRSAAASAGRRHHAHLRQRDERDRRRRDRRVLQAEPPAPDQRRGALCAAAPECFLRLPTGLRCEHCVLQWAYVSWAAVRRSTSVRARTFASTKRGGIMISRIICYGCVQAKIITDWKLVKTYSIKLCKLHKLLKLYKIAINARFPKDGAKVLFRCGGSGVVLYNATIK